MATLEELGLGHLQGQSTTPSSLDNLGLQGLPNVSLNPSADIEETQQSWLSKLNEDIAKPLLNPEIIRKSAGAGISEALAGIQDIRSREVQRQEEAGFSLYDSTELRKSAEDLRDAAKETRKEVDAIHKPKTWVGEVGKGITESMPATLAGTAAALVAGPLAGGSLTATLLGSQVFGQKVNERLQMGDSEEDATNAGLYHAGVEGITEMLNIGAITKLFKAAKAGAALTPALVKATLSEGSQEILAGLGQDMEDSYRGTGTVPAGLSGIKDYFASGQFLESAAKNFLSGAVMGGTMGVALKPVQRAYQDKAHAAVVQMDQVIKQAESEGATTVDVGGSSISVEELKQRQTDIAEAFEIKPEEYVSQESAVTAEAKAKLDGAVNSLKETLAGEASPTVEEQQTVEGPPKPDVSIEIDGVTTYPEEPTGEAPKQVSKFQNFLDTPGFGVFTSGGVDQRLGKITEDIHRDIGMQSKVSLFDLTDLESPENADALKYLESNAHTVEELGAGRIFITGEGDKRTYTIVGRFKEMPAKMQLSTLFHEGMGHAIDYEFFYKTTPEMQQAIAKSFEDWTKSPSAAAFVSPDLFEQMKDPAAFVQKVISQGKNESKDSNIARVFREFKAHQISSAMQKRPEVQSVLERRWAKLAKMLSKLWAKFKEDYLDIATGVESFDQFVNWLYSSKTPAAVETSEAAQQATEVGVENFNIKDVSNNPLVQAVFNSMFEIVDGKRKIKDSWRFQRLYKKAGIWGKITVGDMKQTGYNYKEMDGKIAVRKGEAVILTIPIDASRMLSRDAARMVATNIRDLFIVASLKNPSGVRAKKAAEATLKTVEGQKLKNTVSGRRLAQMWERAFEVAEQSGITPKQAFLEIFGGKHSAFSKFTPGILGTPVLTDNQANRTLYPLREDIKKFQTEYPGLFEQLYGAIQSAPETTGVEEPNVIIEEHSVVADPPAKTTIFDVVDTKVREIAEDWWNRKRPSERIQTFEGLSEKVIFYFELDGKDYTEVSADVRNLIEASLKDFVEEKSGEAIQASIKNKTVLQDQVKELHRAGADTTLAEVSLGHAAKGDDLIGGFTTVHNNLDESQILGHYRDPIDGRDKAVISNEGVRWKATPTGVLIKPGSGILSKSWLSESKAGKLTLDKIFDHPNLFTVYPQLRDLKVTFVNEPGSEIAGSSSWHGSEITINYARSTETVWTTLFHEIQHQIQGIEDFAGGSSPGQMAQVIEEKKQAYEEASDFVTQALKMQRDLVITNLGRIADQAQRRYQGKEWDLAYGIILRMQSTGSFEAALAEFQAERDEAAETYNKVRYETGDTLYVRTAGEDESIRAMRMAIETPHNIRVQLGQCGRRAFSDLSDRDASRLVRTDARSGEVFLNTLQMVDEFSNDELSFASYKGLSDDLAFVRTDKHKTNHPATYTSTFIPTFADILQKYKAKNVLDIFGGVGKIGQVKKFGFTGDVYANEIEPEYNNRSTLDSMQANGVDFPNIGDSRKLDHIQSNSIDAIVTSPVYGNEMSSKAPSRVHTYTTAAGKDLREGNAGGMQWGPAYETLHKEIYKEATRVLKPGGVFVLNMKDFYATRVPKSSEVTITDGGRVQATDWHIRALQDLGFEVVDRQDINVGSALTTTGLRLRKVPYESIVTLQLQKGMSDDLAFVRTKKALKYTEIKEGPYEGILKVRPAPNRKTKARQVKPETLQKRKDELFRFLTNMDAIREHGEIKGLSMAEVMESLGFSRADIRKSIARYNRHKSRFSQNETIYRLAEELGLVNDLTGREGLSSLIQAMFPNQTVAMPQEDGTTKDVVIEGSDGTLQSLTTISKDILINKLQTALLSKTGSKLDIESERTLAQYREEFEKAESGQSGLRGMAKTLAWAQSSAADFLDSTPTGRELSFRLRRFLLTKTIMQRDYLVRLNRYAQVFDTPEKRESLYEVVSGQRPAATPEEENFVHLIKAINRVFGKEMEMLQVKIYKKGGKFEFFKYNKDMSDIYFPHMWKDEWFANPTEGMIRSLLDSGEAQDRAHAKRLIQDFNKNRIRMNKFANIEMARETELGGWITDPVEVYTKYVQQASKRLAGLREFGADPDITLAQMAMKYFKESRDSEGLRKARDLIQRVLGAKVEEGLLKESKTAMSVGIMYSVGLLLQHAVLVQPGVMVNMGAMAGYRNLVKGFATVLPSLWGGKTAEGQKRWAELAGVLAFTVNRELNDVVQDEKSRLKTDKILRSFGITQMDSAMRIVGAIVGKLYATETALRYIERQTPKLALRLKRLGIRPESVLQPGYLQSQKWISQDLRLAALAFTEDSNHVLDPMRTPSIVQGHPLGKLFMLFKNFAFQQHRMMLRLLKDGEHGKFMKVIGGSLAGGALITLVKLLLQGEDPEEVLEKDGIVKFLWRIFMAGGGAGIFAEAAGSALIPGAGPQTGLALDSPVFGLLETLGRGGKSLYNVAIDDYTDQDVNNLYRSSIMALQAASIGVLPAKFGVPINAAVGFARPMSERAFAPSPRMQDTSYLQ